MLLEIGGIEQVKEACRDSWSFRWVDSVAAEIRDGLRSLKRSPAFFLTVVLIRELPPKGSGTCDQTMKIACQSHEKPEGMLKET